MANQCCTRLPLQSELKRSDIRYVFLGNELGARSRDECCYVDDKVQYALLAETPSIEERPVAKLD
jgi:hypothetical protein